jgi:hypothetical protein
MTTPASPRRGSSLSRRVLPGHVRAGTAPAARGSPPSSGSSGGLLVAHDPLGDLDRQAVTDEPGRVAVAEIVEAKRGRQAGVVERGHPDAAAEVRPAQRRVRLAGVDQGVRVTIAVQPCPVSGVRTAPRPGQRLGPVRASARTRPLSWRSRPACPCGRSREWVRQRRACSLGGRPEQQLPGAGTERLIGSRSRPDFALLQLYKDAMSVSVPDVLAVMLLSIQPSRRSCG